MAGEKDPVLERFGDLAQDFPGKARMPIQRQKKVEKATAPPAMWDEKPVYYFFDGEESEFFVIRHLAAALDCSVQSIRSWESRGLLPRSGYRSPSSQRPMAAGSRKGRRLWTRAQINAILQIAEAEGVILNKQPPTKAFAVKVLRAFEALDETQK